MISQGVAPKCATPFQVPSQYLLHQSRQMNDIAILSETTNRENQDRAKIDRRSDDEVLIIVADGAGGMGGGSRAAEIAIRTAENYAANETEFFDPDTCVKLLHEIDRDIHSDSQSGETACVVASIRKNVAVGASVGDSGLWCIEESGITDLTENQHRKPLLGSGMSFPVSFGPFRCGGFFLVATDGLLKYIKADELREIIKSGDTERSANQMIESVRLPSGNLWDDTTVVLLSCHM